MRHRYIFLIFWFLMLVSCEERHPAPFDDIDGVYFYNMSGTMSVTDSVDLTFVYEKEDIMVVPVRIQTIGRVSDIDRPVSLSVTSDDAVEGVDYILPEKAYIPAGESYHDYEITLVRTDELKTGKKMICLEIMENDSFTLPIKEIVQISDTVSTLRYRILFSDMFTSAPVAWDANLVGPFTQQKFELICDVLDIDPDDFNDSSRITLAKLLYISTEMTYYVKDQLERKERGESYDERIFDSVTGEPLVFTKKS